MADPRFYRTAGPFTVAEISATTGARIAGAGQADLKLVDLAPLETAGAGDLSFLSNRRYVAAFEASKAGAAFVTDDLADRAPAAMTLLVCRDPYLANARAAALFYPVAPATPGVSDLAVVDPEARLGAGVSIGHHAVIEAGAVIGDGSVIGPNAFIGRGVAIGKDCVIEANVSITHCVMGDRVRIMPGTSIGQDGFGYVPDPKGHIKVPQLGRVIIEDDVEISSNCAIDRGSGPDTVIGSGTKIDNLVHIGHNVTLGRGCFITGQVGMAGSVKLGNFVSIGGQAGISGHLKVGDGVQIAAQSGIMNDVPAGATMMGSPAFPKTTYFRQLATLARLTKGKGR